MMLRGRAYATALALVLAIFAGTISGLVGHAQEESPPRPSHIHNGDCDELGEVVQPLTPLAVPVGDVAGNADAVVAEAAYTEIAQTLQELTAADHAVKVHLSREQIETYLACGDIGGVVDANGALIVGLKELDNSGYTGIAYLVPTSGGTSVSVMIARVLPGGAAGDASAALSGTPAGAESAADSPRVVEVSLTEFAIDMPSELPAGATRFHIVNNGGAPHSFVLEGAGTRKALANPIQPGQASWLNVDLEPGEYTIFCPVGEGAHRAQGMELNLRVLG
jgi:hypothetical protein